MPLGNPIRKQNESRVVSVLATEGQTVFTVQGGYIINQISVFRNGVRLSNSEDFTAGDGSTVTLNNAANVDDRIEFHIFDRFTVQNAIVGAASTQTINGDLVLNGKLFGELDVPSINLTGIITASNLNVTGISTFSNVDFSNLDVTGITTVGKQVHVGTGVSIAAGGLNVTAGISTFQAVQGTTGTFSGQVDLNGDVNLGNATSDTITVTGHVDSDIVPSGSTRDLGGSGTEWRNLYTTNGVVASDDIAVHSGDSDTKIRFPSADTVTVETGGSERFRVSSDGKVGINITDNTTDFHVRNAASPGDASFKMGGSNSTASGLRISYSNSGNTSTIIKQNYRATSASALMEFDSGIHVFKSGTGGDERIRIDSSGRLLIGTNTTLPAFGASSALQVAGTGFASGSVLIRRDSDNAFSGALVFGKSRGSLGGNTIVQSGDQVGTILWTAADGTDLTTDLAQIKAKVDGTPGSDDMPGRIEFHTTADGASGVTERLRINSEGAIHINDGSASTARFDIGNGSDLKIFHTNPGSYIQDGSSALTISSARIDLNSPSGEYMARFYQDAQVELYHNNAKKLETAADRVNITGHLFILTGARLYIQNGFQDSTSSINNTGGSNDSNLNFYVKNAGTESTALKIQKNSDVELPQDNQSLYLGASQDLQLYHSGNFNFIVNNNSKNLAIQAKNGENAIVTIPDGAVQLYHNNVERLATFTEGVDVHVSGNAGLRIRGNAADVNPRLVFRRKNNDGNNSEPAAIRMTYVAGTTHESGHLDFLTNGDSGSASLSVKVRFQNDGVKYFDSTFDTTASNARKSYFSGTGQLVIGRNAHESAIVFQDVSNNVIGTITRGGGSSVAYNTTSDYRLKENVVDISDAITRLKTLKPKRFNFISDPSITVDGFIAHEVTAVPEAVEGEKDAVVTQAMIDSGQVEQKSVGDPIYQGIDQSKLVPLLTAALQEAVAKIETLETKVAALEGS